jgi:Photosynthesis system II assembly factor YCF48
MNELPKIVQARLRPEPPGAHPDADVLTAFYEQALPENERPPVLAHLAQCAECREVVALALPPTPVGAPSVHEVSGPATTWGWSGLMRWASVAACALVVGAAVMIYKPAAPSLRTGRESDVPAAQQEKVPARVDQTQPASADQLDKKLVTPAAPQVSENMRATAVPKGATAAGIAGERLKSVPAPVMKTESPAAAAQNQLVAQPRPSTSEFDAATGGAVGGVIQKRMAAARPAAAAAARQNQTVEVAANADGVSPELKPEDTPGRAKVGTMNGPGVSQEQTPALYANSFRKGDQASPLGVPARWQLSPEGQLQRSFDQGLTWESAPLVDRMKITAWSAVGTDIWVGGAAGVLYHSSDNGWKWTLVKPTAGEVALKADVTKLEFTDAQHGTVTTSDGQVWTTADGGRNWQVKP